MPRRCPLPAATCSAPAPARSGGGRGGGGAASPLRRRGAVQRGGGSRPAPRGAGQRGRGGGRPGSPAGARDRRPGLGTRRQHDPPGARSERGRGGCTDRAPGGAAPSASLCSALPGPKRHKEPRKILGLVSRPRGTDGHRLPLLLGALRAATLPQIPEQELSAVPPGVWGGPPQTQAKSDGLRGPLGVC
ncbi:collagen alpha-1(III) chain-like [Harpia harpyja]|uniref:collagen alpha-1(III) chain-like n=1 Tax=Harpia harpyja TaxID=202280 RepID=UPI0022B11FF4|nr:collagen alpha-1(III) chain-like [Harpia harpyja]